MALVGYARCSTTPQELEHQLEGLKAALVDQLFSEHISGAAPFLSGWSCSGPLMPASRVMSS